MLHVLNGDETAAGFATAGLAGDRLVWRDILVEGPATAAPDARAAWLAERLAIDRADYARGAEEQARGLAVACAQDEVILWFEQDLFCAVTLWSLLDWFASQPARPRLSLVFPEAEEALGRLAPERLATLFADRRPVTDDALALGRRAWAAYASADPLASAPFVEQEEPALPFVRSAFRCHLGRYPSVKNGLNEVETAALSVLRRGPRGFADLFRDVGAHPRVRRHGMGDVQFAACVRGLEPLLEIFGHGVTSAELSITQRGRDVVAGDADWLDIRPIDTWLGGVHLRAGRPLWRWDGAFGRLVSSRG